LISTIDNTPLSDVLLTLKSNDFQQDFTTSANGTFDFGEVPMSTSYSLSATKKSDYLEGVSTLDLVSIQKHILGTEPLEDAFRYIAADINKDERISAVDLIQLRKLILGYTDEFPSNNSYRFYDQNEVLEMENPWTVQEELQISDIDDFGSAYNFAGIKIGDVNVTQVEKRSRDNSVINYKIRDSENKEENIIDFYFAEDEEFKAIQLNLFIRNLSLEGFRSGQLELSSDNYNIIDGQELRISENFEQVESFKSDKPLFSLVTDDNNKLDQLTLIQDIAIKSELYVSTRDVISIDLKAIDVLPISPNSLALYPNPFSDELIVSFDLLDEQEVTIEIFDVNGRKLYSYANKLTAGKNTVELNDIPFTNSSSLLISRVTIGSKVYTNKIMQSQH